MENKTSCNKDGSIGVIDNNNKRVDPNVFKNINDSDLKIMAKLMNMQRRGK